MQPEGAATLPMTLPARQASSSFMRQRLCSTRHAPLSHCAAMASSGARSSGFLRAIDAGELELQRLGGCAICANAARGASSPATPLPREPAAGTSRRARSTRRTGAASRTNTCGRRSMSAAISAVEVVGQARLEARERIRRAAARATGGRAACRSDACAAARRRRTARAGAAASRTRRRAAARSCGVRQVEDAARSPRPRSS